MVAEMFELVEEVASAAVGVVVAREVVDPDLGVDGPSASICQMMISIGWAMAIRARC